MATECQVEDDDVNGETVSEIPNPDFQPKKKNTIDEITK